jgi:DNA repair ATPase RecN
LKALGERLIEIHGQNEHQALLERSQQLALLDAFGGHSEALERVRALAGSWREVNAAIREISGDKDHGERIEWLGHQVSELETHALDAGRCPRSRTPTSAWPIPDNCCKAVPALPTCSMATASSAFRA